MNKSDFKIFKNSRTLSNVTDKLLKKRTEGNDTNFDLQDYPQTACYYFNSSCNHCRFTYSVYNSTQKIKRATYCKHNQAYLVNGMSTSTVNPNENDRNFDKLEN